MPVGFAVVCRDDAVEFQTFGESNAVCELVSCDSDDNLQVVLMGRLHYRRELLDRLSLATDSKQPANDAALVLAAYRRWAVDGIEQLEGDFAVAVFDRKQNRLVASRDPMGGYPIYWMQQAETIAVGTLLRPLVALLGDRQLNDDFFGEFLMLPYAEIDYFPETPFVGIQRLVSGSRLIANLSSKTVTQHEFWSWPERITDPGTDSPEEIGDRYGELLRQAVGECLGENVACHLSGGMDSTSVALLARDALSNDSRPMHALSLIYENLANLGNETPYLEEALNQHGIVPHRIAADDLLDYDFFRTAPLHDEPFTGLFRVGTDIAMIRAAADAGADTILTGLGADEQVASVPYYLADLVKRGRIAGAWSESSRWAQSHNCSRWRFLGPFGLSPLMPAWFHAGLGPLVHSGYADWDKQNQWTIAPWVLPEFARKTSMRRRALDNIRRNYRSNRSVVKSEVLARVRQASGDWVRYSLAAPQGIVISHPFRDRRLVAFGIGSRCRVTPLPGQQKRVLAHAMRDVLPASIRNRRSKGHFNSVYFAGLSKNLQHLEDLIRNSSVDELGLFDKQQLLACLNKAALGVGGLGGSSAINNSLAIIKWLSQQPEWLAASVEPSRTWVSE